MPVIKMKMTFMIIGKHEENGSDAFRMIKTTTKMMTMTTTMMMIGGRRQQLRRTQWPDNDNNDNNNNDDDDDDNYDDDWSQEAIAQAYTMASQDTQRSQRQRAIWPPDTCSNYTRAYVINIIIVFMSALIL